jgi:hypothetical protein
MKPTPAQIAGVVRAVAPAAIAYAAGRGIDISWLTNPDVMAALAAIGCALWSVQAKRKPKAKLVLAEQPKINQ